MHFCIDEYGNILINICYGKISLNTYIAIMKIARGILTTVMSNFYLKPNKRKTLQTYYLLLLYLPNYINLVQEIDNRYNFTSQSFVILIAICFILLVRCACVVLGTLFIVKVSRTQLSNLKHGLSAFCSAVKHTFLRKGIFTTEMCKSLKIIIPKFKFL